MKLTELIFNIIRVEIVKFRSTYANFPAQERTWIPLVKNSSCAPFPPHANFNKLTLKLACHYEDRCSTEMFLTSTELASQEFKGSQQTEQFRILNRILLTRCCYPNLPASQHHHSPVTCQEPSWTHPIPFSQSSWLCIAKGPSFTMFLIVTPFFLCLLVLHPLICLLFQTSTFIHSPSTCNRLGTVLRAKVRN